MADEFVTATTLASYPGVVMPANSETSDLVVELTNGEIVDLIRVPDPIPFRVRAIAFEVAARALRNPEGAESITKGVDDWKKTVRFSQADKLRAGVYLTDGEKAELLGAVGRRKKRTGSIQLKVPNRGFGC